MGIIRACTVHKVQGLALKNVVSLELRKQRFFNYGQIYVALCHATSLQGLFILGKLDSKHIKANPKVKEEYERLRNLIPCQLRSRAETECNNSALTISLLNIRSLRKHCDDIKVDPILFNSDVIALTETQLLPNDLHNVQIAESLQPLQIYRQDHSTNFVQHLMCMLHSIHPVTFTMFVYC